MAKEGHQRVFKLVNGKTGPEYINNTTKEDDENNIEDWIRMSYRESRRVKLPGTVSPRLLKNLFREQCTTNREDIAMHYLGLLVNTVYVDDGSAPEEFIPDNAVRQKLHIRLKAERQSAEDEISLSPTNSQSFLF